MMLGEKFYEGATTNEVVDPMRISFSPLGDTGIIQDLPKFDGNRAFGPGSIFAGGAIPGYPPKSPGWRLEHPVCDIIVGNQRARKGVAHFSTASGPHRQLISTTLSDIV